MHNYFKTSYTYILFFLLIFSCNQNNDSDLKKSDSFGGQYYTQLGCLVHGPWEATDNKVGFNTKLFINDVEISSKASNYTSLQKDLVFELNKDGTIAYWLKSENAIIDTSTNGITPITTQSNKNDNLKKLYNTGHWKVNLKDSVILIHFDKIELPELKFKYSYLGNESANFEQIFFFDSTLNGKKVRFKKVNTINFQHPFIRF